MKVKYSELLEFDDGISFDEILPTYLIPISDDSSNIFSVNTNNMINIEKMFGVRETIYLKNQIFKPISISSLYRSKGEDGAYHAIYIQIDFHSGEYYIGKVNRKKWVELKRYQGSGVKFKAKYEKHKDRFGRFYLYTCKTEKETEKIEASIVDDVLLSDPFCLNLVKGGGGVSTIPHSMDRKARQSAYMKEHPERYKAMLEAAHNFDKQKILERNKNISKALSTEENIKKQSERMKNWKETDPEGYRQSRINNAKAVASKRVQAKRKATLKKRNEENPEEYKERMRKWAEATHTPEVRAKRSASLRKYIIEHPDEVRKRSLKSAEKRMKAVLMIDIKTNEIIKEFKSVKAAGDWLRDNKITNSVNPGSSIAAASVLKKIPGHGTKQTAYGFKWKYK